MLLLEREPKVMPHQRFTLIGLTHASIIGGLGHCSLIRKHSICHPYQKKRLV